MIYILEGPDGVGKTTLAQAIQAETKGHILHCSWNKDWDMERYFRVVMNSAINLNEYQDVIIDRWVPSEFVYGTVFRGGPSSDMSKMVEDYVSAVDIKWVYCRNENVVENHKKHLKERDEMFDDMSKVQEEFDDYVQYSTNNWLHLPWVEYDYDKVDMTKFVKELTKNG